MRTFLSFALILISISMSFGQCNSDVTMISLKTEYLDSLGVVQRTVDEQSTIESNKSQIIIISGSGTIMTGTIKSATCNWSVPYKVGTTVIKAEFSDPSGSLRHATLTTEGKGGQVAFLMEIDELPTMKIRVSVSSFAEKK